ncbi:MAG TPA: hypothetical protein VGF40_04005 [Thermoanaerobaculia bacterium]
MQNDVITFAVGPAVAPELALAADGLAEGLRAAGRASEVLIDPWPETLAGRRLVVEVGDVDHAPDRCRLDFGSRSDLELVDAGERASSLPFARPSLPAMGGRPNILFVGGDAGRRTRMMAKTFEALRRRGGPAIVVWRPLPDELLRQRFPGEVHSDPSGPELGRLLGSAAALVEVSDEATAEGMLVAAIGRASGIPTVVHAALPVQEWDGRITVSEWSGEAFADAALAAARRPANAELGAAIRREAGAQLALLLPATLG